MVYNIYFDIAGLFVNVVLILLACFRRIPPRLRNTIFRLMLFSNLFATIFDISSAYTITYPGRYPIATHYMIAIMYYIFHNLSAFLYLQYGLETDGKRNKNKTVQFVIKCVFGLVFLLILTTPLTKLVFYFDNNMVYHHGPLLYLLYSIGLLSVIYVLYLKLTNKEVLSTFQIVTNFGYAIALFSAFLYHILNDRVLIELFAIDLGYLVMFVSMDNPEQYLHKTITVYNRHAFEEYVHHIIHLNRKFNILIFTPKEANNFRKKFSKSEMFTMDKNIIGIVNNHKRNDKFFVLSDLCYAIILDDCEKQIDDINNKFEKEVVVNNKEYKIEMSYAIIRFPEIAKNNNDVFVLLEDLLYRLNNQISSEPLEANPNVLLTERRKNIEDLLVRAIKKDNFFIEYEPIFDIKSSNALNAEAKLMIQDGTNIIPMSTEFFKVADGDGLVMDIDEITLKKVGEFISRSNIENLGINNIVVNLSMVDLMNIRFINRLKELIEEYNLPCDHICFKIIDLDLSVNADIISKNMNEVHDLGFKFVVDKYGQNSVNLSTLINLPVIGVKLGEKVVKEAINDPKRKKILYGFISVLKKLDYTVACSDITSVSEDKLVKACKFDFVQGPFYGKQMKDDDFIKFYKDQLYSILTSINRS